MSIALERWNEGLGKNRYLIFSEANSEFTPSSWAGNVSGWYAQYKEGLFAYWQDDSKQFVHWKSCKIELSPEIGIDWKSEFTGRYFEASSGAKIILSIKYRTLARDPWGVITEDDWWGLENDLPSFIHSGHTKGNLAQLLAEWNNRRDS